MNILEHLPELQTQISWLTVVPGQADGGQPGVGGWSPGRDLGPYEQLAAH